MKNSYLKIISTTILAGVFLFLAFGSGESKKTEPKTNFKTSSELWEYIQYSNYDALKAEWGNGRVDKPWDASGIGELDMQVNVYWDNVVCEGKPIRVCFKNDYETIDKVLDPNPSSVISYNLKGEY